MKIRNLAEQPSLASQYMAELRDVDLQTDRMRFRHNLNRLGQIMAYEVSKEIAFSRTDVTTPLGTAHCDVVGEPVVVATILRAGLPLHEGVLSFFGNAENAFVSAYRKYRPGSDEYGVYKYPHDYPGHVVAQEYMPPSLKDKRYYIPGELGSEAKIRENHIRSGKL